MGYFFNNPKVLSRSWYNLLPSSKLKKKSSKSVPFFDYKIALFRDENGKASALYAYCPHMGADLGIGKVLKNTLVCPYHKWAFNQEGKCTRVSGKIASIDNYHTISFPILEKYGFIWIFNGEKADFPFPEIPWTKNDHYILSFPNNKMHCHPHIVGTNNPDFNHLETLHHFHLDNKPEQIRSKHQLIYKYKIQFKPKNIIDKLFGLYFGTIYDFHVIQYGSNLIIMDISSKRYHFKTLIALNPTVEGKTISKFFLFLSKGKNLTRILGLNFLKLPFLLPSVLKIQLQDLPIYQNIQFKIPQDEPTILNHINLINSLGIFHPKDASRSIPSTVNYLVSNN